MTRVHPTATGAVHLSYVTELHLLRRTDAT